LGAPLIARGVAEQGWAVVVQAIAIAFQAHDAVMIETLGAGGGFDAFHQTLQQHYVIQYIRVQADLEVCLARVERCSEADHIPVSLEQVRQYNAIAAQVSYPWHLVITNTPPLSEAEIVAAIKSVLSVL